MSVLQPGTPEYEAEMKRRDEEIANAPKKTRVVNVRSGEFDVYVGRAVARAKDPRCREESKFGNPFIIGQHGDREDCIAQFKQRLLKLIDEQPHVWIPALRELKGKRLGCWCKPEACHGDVLAEIADQMVDT